MYFLLSHFISFFNALVSDRKTLVEDTSGIGIWKERRVSKHLLCIFVFSFLESKKKLQPTALKYVILNVNEMQVSSVAREELASL